MVLLSEGWGRVDEIVVERGSLVRLVATLETIYKLYIARQALRLARQNKNPSFT